MEIKQKSRHVQCKGARGGEVVNKRKGCEKVRGKPSGEVTPLERACRRQLIKAEVGVYIHNQL